MEPASTQPLNQQAGSIISAPADRVRIVSTPGTCSGKPRIDGHRITVADISIWHERMGMSVDEIVSAYPSLKLADVHGALAYYYENRDRIDSDIRESERLATEMKAKSGPSLVEQKLKQRTQDGKNDSLPSG